MSEVYLSGEAPHVTKVDGTPTSVKVRVLDRANSTLVAELMSDIDGSWRVEDGISKYRTYDVIFSSDGYRDIIWSDVKPHGYEEGIENIDYDPYWDNVVSLLRFNGNITDEKGKIWTRTSGGYSTGVFNTAAVFNKLSAEKILTNTHVDFYFGSSDFTIEVWVYLNAAAGNDQWRGILGKRENNPDMNWSIYVAANSRNVVFEYNTEFNKTSRSLGCGELTLKTWTFLTVQSRNGVLSSFKDGVLMNTIVGNSGGIFNDNTRLVIGALSYPTTSVNSMFDGMIDEIRITKGVARYTENFTPPAEPFPNRGP